MIECAELYGQRCSISTIQELGRYADTTGTNGSGGRAMASYGVPLCEECSAPAQRPCTRCGKLFCDIHLRYGNPHYRRDLAGKVGYYCKQCWNWHMFLAGVRRTIVIGLTIFMVAVILIGVIKVGTLTGMIKITSGTTQVTAATPSVSFMATISARGTASYATVSAEHTAAASGLPKGGQ